ncbi:TetR/AcrR family transcriptional regulator [Agromyces atrinae]|uniref:AcrR family transcriptional regulator n=1 Tax=Agromyces atrinae TaxID=592376 RepID=A0A4Q2M180_9MICO|nr:TetR/AcrR family transcriptional regulator [Agromyces atrinae]MCI2959102.1 TetR/AcrR family transcriptional regulator [Agromyces atrinae]NYD65670.1 AcrR family transcriptional regulator [Agromyces atrinae]RXZ85468.1 TetR/AcrR family transcriptional regulator [Agromyces atrinae]
MPSVDSSTRLRAHDELRLIAIEQFATVGFAGASLQQIADIAGYSKSSVLYHFASKEALLEAAIAPAVDALEVLFSEYIAAGRSDEARAAFIEQFVDFLIRHRLEVHTFINQGSSLRGIPIIDRANAVVAALGDAVCDEHASTVDRMRFGVALGGAAFILVADMTFPDLGDIVPVDDARDALITVIGELLALINR